MRKTITVIAVLIVLALIGVGIVQYVNTSDDSDFIGQPGEPTGTETTEPPVQPDWCPAVEVIAAGYVGVGC